MNLSARCGVETERCSYLQGPVRALVKFAESEEKEEGWNYRTFVCDSVHHSAITASPLVILLQRAQLGLNNADGTPVPVKSSYDVNRKPIASPLPPIPHVPMSSREGSFGEFCLMSSPDQIRTFHADTVAFVIFGFTNRV